MALQLGGPTGHCHSTCMLMPRDYGSLSHKTSLSYRQQLVSQRTTLTTVRPSSPPHLRLQVWHRQPHLHSSKAAKQHLSLCLSTACHVLAAVVQHASHAWHPVASPSLA